ncbi:hypothetical protein [Vreelandella profundi]|uniref:hypothetical protein n=1 Tax=Vreelandella profundi TaxID=2852117 RepID=UPI001EEFC694|nr:hypothetical protein [Halomonas profundi]
MIQEADVSLKRVLNLCLLAFLLLWPVVDALNGYLYYNYSSFTSVSAPYKALGFVFVLMLLFVFEIFSFIKLFILAALSVFCIVYQYLVYGYAVESISWIVRALLTVALILYLVSGRGCDFFWCKNKLAKLMMFYFFVMAFNVALGVLGVGESQYSGGIGGKGFIIAGNEMSFLMLVSASIMLVHVSDRVCFLKLFFLLLVLLVFFLMKATKVAILGICLVYFCVLIHRGCFKVKYLPVVYLSMLVGGAIVFFLGYQFVVATGLMDRMIYLYHLHGGFWGAMLSGRIIFLQDAFNELIVGFSFFDVLFGIGVDQLLFVEDLLVEIDLIDVFMAFGVVGPLVFYFPWILGLVWSCELFKESPRSGVCFIFLIFIFIVVSVTAGHVVNSGISSSATAFFISYLYMLKEEQKNARRDE